LPIIDAELLRTKDEIDSIGKWYVISSRGCPFKCIFCSANAVSGSKIRYRSVEKVIFEIKKATEKYKIKEIDFEDDNFIFDEKRVIEICNSIIKEKLNIKWRCMGRVDLLEKYHLSTLLLMKISGCRQINIGVESASDEVLVRIKKNITISQVNAVIIKLHSVGIKVKGYFIFGFPFENESDLEKTKEFILSSGLDDINISILRLFPHTEIYDYCIKNNLLNFEDVSAYLQFKYVDSEGSCNQRISKAALYLVSHYVPINKFLSPFKIVDNIYEIYSLFYGGGNGRKGN